MSREVKRVALDFDWPRDEVWEGYLMPDSLGGLDCADCGGTGYSPRARELNDLWYGYAPFRPEDNGSTPLTPATPAVRAFAERNIAYSPGFYGTGERAIHGEARRLCALWNDMWSHHVNAEDVAALVEAGRLKDFTHTWSRETRWQPIDPPVVPTPEQVNEWSIRTMGHDGINGWVVLRARCAREGVDVTCSRCEGHGSVEAYPGQRTEAEAWKPTEPPAGEGWQLWETVSEGSPVSPVFPSDEALAGWLTTPEGAMAIGTRRYPVSMTMEQACGFVRAGWAPTGIGNAGGYHDGAEYIATEAAVGDLFDGDTNAA